MSSTIVHRDLLRRELKVGDSVAVAEGNELIVCTITKFTPKMMRVHPITGLQYYRSRGYLKYPEQCVLLDGTYVTMYILRNSV